MPTMSRSMVLGNDGLLGDILHHVDSPTTLVRAALVSKHWYRGASFPALLRRFRALNPPRLLGVYVSGDGVRRPEFVRVPTLQPPEHTAAAYRANFGFGDAAEFSSIVLDCRNGHVLYEFAQAFYLARSAAVRTPLMYPGQDVAVLPPPLAIFPRCPHAVAMLLPDDGDDATCYRLDIIQWNQVVGAKVSVLRSDEWSVCCSAGDRLAKTPGKILTATALLAGGKIYMMTVAGYILGLDLSTGKFFIVELPEGVTFEYEGKPFPCRGDDSALYLFNVKGDELSVWLRRAGNRGGAEWVLKETISVKKTCAEFIENADGGDAPAEMGPDPPADGGDAPMEEVGPEPPADGGDAPMEEEGPEPQPADADNVDVPMEELGPEVPADGGDVPMEEVEPEEPPANDDDAPIEVVGVGDNAEFVFLELGDSGVIVYLHMESKKVEKVHQRDPDDDNVIRVHPLTMIWPPTFPALPEAEDDEDEAGHQE